MTESPVVHVAAAAVLDGQGRVMISRRPEHVHQGGLWEFPGGKIEGDESVRVALARELHEELGIEVTDARPLIRIHHDYPDKSVLLDVWCVDRFEGEAHGREGQPLQWVMPEDLSAYPFPAANRAIVNAVRLTERYLITPEPGDDEQKFLSLLKTALQRGIKMVQFRANTLSLGAYTRLAYKIRRLCHEHTTRLILNAAPELVAEIGADGVHLNSQRLMSLSSRPLGRDFWVGASCHNADELRHAELIDADFAVLGPVAKTASHPDSEPLGWKMFHTLTDRASFPVYALGGMELADCGKAFTYGAQGIAAIRGLWSGGDDNKN